MRRIRSLFFRNQRGGFERKAGTRAATNSSPITVLEHARKPHSDYGSGFLTATRSSDSTYFRYVSSSTPSSRLTNPLPRYQKRVSRHTLIVKDQKTSLPWRAR